MLTTTARRQVPKQRSTDLRGAILKAARDLLFHRGAERISARRIAARAGCSATAIYLYYRNLNDVLHHLRMEGHELLARYLRSAQRNGPAITQIEEMGRAYFRFGLENPEFYDLMFLARSSRTARREEIRQEMFPLILLRDAIQRGIESGAIRSETDPMLASNALWAQVHGVTSLAVQGLLFETTVARQEQVLDQVLSSARSLLQK